ncbi:MAG: ferredoxin [Acidobacteriota bacterium]
MRSSNGRGMGRNRTQSGEGAGPSGQCVCVKCNYLSAKKRGVPCMDEKCPDCGATLLREGGSHHQSAINKKK